MTYGNKSIINTLENNLIFVFLEQEEISHGFSLDKNLPYIEDENEDENGIIKTAILFRLFCQIKKLQILIPKSKKNLSQKNFL